MSKQRRYSAEFKLDAVSRMDHCKTITGLAKELGIRRTILQHLRCRAVLRDLAFGGSLPMHDTQ